ADDDITSCCKTEDGCCGPDWGLHCCNFVAKICCYGDERVHSLHHHNHRNRHWHWHIHWFQIAFYALLLMLIVSGLLLCCKTPRPTSRVLGEYTILPGYDYSSSQTVLPTGTQQNKAPAHTSQATDEYPLIDYHNGQPRGQSVNANQAVSSPIIWLYHPYCLRTTSWHVEWIGGTGELYTTL
ncbi:hypothetical protein ANN_15989, partial [Periplaneta americana]